jgi:hypothetical protein
MNGSLEVEEDVFESMWLVSDPIQQFLFEWIIEKCMKILFSRKVKIQWLRFEKLLLYLMNFDMKKNLSILSLMILVYDEGLQID